MAGEIYSAAPMVYDLRTNDLSKRKVPRQPKNIPLHVPKFYTYGQTGPEGGQLVSGNELQRMYGLDTFDERSKYCTHTTPFINGCNSTGNAMILERVIPSDAGPKPTICLGIDVNPTTVNIYRRNSDGSLFLDNLGSPVIDGTAPGFNVRLVTTYLTDPALFGQRTITNGAMTDVTNGQSKIYPLIDFEHNFQGADGNNDGIRIWASTLMNGNLPVDMMAAKRAYPFKIAVVRRDTPLSTPAVTPTLMNDQSISFVLKPGVIDPNTDSEMYLGDIFLDQYQNLSNPVYPKTYGKFGRVAIYQDNIDTLLQLFHNAEKSYINAESDFSIDVTDKYLFNLFGGTNSKGHSYFTYQFVDDSTSIRLSEYTNILARGGSDGTLSAANFESLVQSKLRGYSDESNPLVYDPIINCETHIYDSGYSLNTKHLIPFFISLRGDTKVVMATYISGQPVNTESEEGSLAIALKTYCQMFPESAIFGTPVMRADLYGRSVKILNSRYKSRVPVTYEVMMQRCKYQGKSDGRWKNGENFDGAPGSIMKYTYDLSIAGVPATVAKANWAKCLNYPIRYDMDTFFFPAHKTVYDDDTSVLNSSILSDAIIALNRMNQAAWREFSGVSGLTDTQLVRNVKDFMNKLIKDRFDNRYIIVVTPEITDMDELRGYSWSLTTDIGAPGMKTVMTTRINARRYNDMLTTQ